MSSPKAILPLLVSLCLVVSLGIRPVRADEPSKPTLSATEIATRLSAIRQDGANYLRVRLEIAPSAGAPTVLQLQIKVRHTAQATDAVYQVLFPKERKGEAVLLHRPADRAPSGTIFLPADNSLHPLDAGKMQDPFFGSGFSYEDLVDNFFAWSRQTLAGNEVVAGSNCVILESRPGKEDHSSYALVRSWIDPARLVPLRVEKYLAGDRLARRIDTTRFSKDDKGRVIPAGFEVHRPGRDEVTTLEGSRSEFGMVYADAEFTPEGIKQITPPRKPSE